MARTRTTYTTWACPIYLGQINYLKLLIQNVKQRQLDQYMQIWNSNIESASKSKTYIIFKQTLHLGNYFIKIPEKM